MEEHLGIELRSEKVRNIIGKIPPSLVRYGIGYITLLLLLLGMGAFYIPYSESIRAEVSVLPISGREVTAQALLPYSYVSRVKINMPVRVELTDYKPHTQNHVEGRVAEVTDSLITINGKGYFNAIIRLEGSEALPRLQAGMGGTILILLSDGNFIEYLFKRKK